MGKRSKSKPELVNPQANLRYFDPDLINPEAVKHELDFLNNIDARGKQFYDEHFIRNALRRYEAFWIPLVAKLSSSDPEWDDLQVAPPLDVHWVWHVHMLAPAQYKHDLKNNSVLQRALNHR